MWSAEAAHISAPLAGHPQLPGTGQSSGCPDARGTTSEGSLPPSPGGRELSTGGRQGASQPRTRGATRVPWAYPVLVLDDVLPDGGQRGPLAVTGRTHSTAFVGLELTHWERTSTSAWAMAVVRGERPCSPGQGRRSVYTQFPPERSHQPACSTGETTWETRWPACPASAGSLGRARKCEAQAAWPHSARAHVATCQARTLSVT